MRKVHELKIWPLYFDLVVKGIKTFEIRKNDRNFEVGDLIDLMEWDNFKEVYTGRSFLVIISCIVEGEHLGIMRDYVILGIRGVSLN